MADYESGIPQQPLIIFMDGNAFLVTRSSIVMQEGKPFYRLVIGPFDWVKRREGITEEQLDYSEDPYGVLIQYYPASSVLVLSENPEKPLWLGLTTWKGEKLPLKSSEMVALVKLTDEVDTLHSENARLKAEVERLRQDNVEIIRRGRKFKEQLDKIYGKGEKLVLPEEFVGARIPVEEKR